MSYQQVKTPKFYVNCLNFLDFTGVQSIPNIYKTLPVNVNSDWGSYNDAETYYSAGSVKIGESVGDSITNEILNDKSFVAVLGHSNIHNSDQGSNYKFQLTYNQVDNNIIECTNIINYSSTVMNEPDYHGFSIGEFDGLGMSHINFGFKDNGRDIGGIIIGTQYTMEHSPDLNLTLSRESGLTQKLETKGGSTLTNTYWTNQPKWGNLAAWELSDDDNYNEVKAFYCNQGSRIWQLSFSYLDQENVFPKNSNIKDFISGTSGDNFTDNNILNSNSFFSQVLNKTGMGALPFIFSPDSSSVESDNFAICMFDQNSFEFKKITDSMYSISLTIREVW